MAQDHCVFERVAAQVEEAVFQAGVLVGVLAVVFDREGRCLRSVQDFQRIENHFDFTGGDFRILRSPFHHFAGRLDHELAAQFVGGLFQLGGRVLVDYQLRDAVAVTDVDEGHCAEVAHFLHPTREGDLL